MFKKSDRKLYLSVNIHTTTINCCLFCKEKSLNVIEQFNVEAEQLKVTLIKIKAEYPRIIANLILPYRHVMMKTLHFANYFKMKEITHFLAHNAESYFNCKVSDIFYDYEFLNSSQRSLRIIACKREYLSPWLNIFQQAKVDLQYACSDVLAIELFLQFHQLVNQNEVYAVVLKSSNDLLMTIIADGWVQFVNNVALTTHEESFLWQEIPKFFRLYEVNKSYAKTITRMIFLGFDKKINASMQQEPYLSQRFLSSDIVVHGEMFPASRGPLLLC